MEFDAEIDMSELLGMALAEYLEALASEEETSFVTGQKVFVKRALKLISKAGRRPDLEKLLSKAVTDSGIRLSKGQPVDKLTVEEIGIVHAWGFAVGATFGAATGAGAIMQWASSLPGVSGDLTRH